MDDKNYHLPRINDDDPYRLKQWKAELLNALVDAHHADEMVKQAETTRKMAWRRVARAEAIILEDRW